MPRSHRVVPPGCALHVVNRGNDRRNIFPEPVDYAAFLVLLREAKERFEVRLFAYCLMPNHFHLVVSAHDRHSLSAYMHFIERSHACDLRAIARTKGYGHVFQRRYWSKVIEGDGHLLCALRYVEANPLRARLVERAERWEWSSLFERQSGERDLLHRLPHELPPGWSTIVNTPLEPIDLESVRSTAVRGRPARPVDLRKPKK